MIEEFLLSEGDKASGLWLRLREHFQEQLAAVRLRNDDPTLSEQATAAYRGEIRVLKRLIRLGADRPFGVNHADR